MHYRAALVGIFLLASGVVGQDHGESQDKVEAKKLTPLQALLAADDEKRPKALIRYLQDQVSTGAVYAGQYSGLLEVREPALALLTSWILEPPDEVFQQTEFRTASINALRDLVTGKDTSEKLMESLREISGDEFEEERVQQAAIYALAQFGDRTHVDKAIKSATESTKSENLQLKGNSWNRLADIYYNLREYEAASNAYKQILGLAEKTGVNSTHAVIYYNCACSMALAADVDGAIDYLGKALKLNGRTGPLGRRLVETDQDISSLRDDDRFKALWNEHFGEAEKKTDKGDGDH